MLTPRGKLTTIYSFCKSDCTDGAKPQQLLEATDGNLYGTTFDGGFGGSDGGGTIFRITPSGAFSVLYSFCSQSECTDGWQPQSLIQGSDGNLYGVTYQGGGAGDCLGTLGCGTVFELTLDGVLTTLYVFQPTNSFFPTGLTQGTDGKFYGAAGGGTVNANCQYGCGTIFRLDTGLGPFVSFVLPAGRANRNTEIIGQGFTGTTAVSLNGIPASFTVKSDTFIEATVPAGATTGYVAVTTPSGTLTSNVPFQVIP